MLRTSVVAVGECMLELVRCGEDWRLSFAGDTFNTALYLERLGVHTAYLTALGTDPFSRDMRSAWVGEGLDVSLVLTDPERLPGLYAIQTDAIGERSFFYWRHNSAARNLFSLPGVEAALERASEASLLYFSGITLSLFCERGRQRLLEIARMVRRNGGLVAFDMNYRLAGWPSAPAAREAIERMAPEVSIALPTFEDAALLFGDRSPEQTARYWQQAGAQEVAVKLGAQGCLVAQAGRLEYVPAATAVTIVDTTGAGDSFNAGYLAARIRGSSPLLAAQGAHRLAAEVIAHAGAILPIQEMARIKLMLTHELN